MADRPCECGHSKAVHAGEECGHRGGAAPDYTYCECVAYRPPSSMSVVDEDRLTRRNPGHLDEWKFR